MIKDTSPLEHKLNVNLSKKNIVDIKNPSHTLNAIYEVGGDGVATLTRGNLSTNSTEKKYASRAYWSFGNYDDFVGKTLTVSVNITEKPEANDLIRIYADYKQAGKETDIKTIGVTTTGKKTLTFTVPENTGGWTTLGLYFYCQSLGTSEVVGNYIKFEDLQVEEGSVATDYSPYVEKDIEDITITKYGKNFVDYNNYKVTSSGDAIFNGSEITLTKAREGNPPSIIFFLG